MTCIGLTLLSALFLLLQRFEMWRTPQVPIQNPPDITFTLAPKNGKLIYRIGEEVDMEFQYSSTTLSRYKVDPLYRGNHRTTRLDSPFIVEPVAETADPMADVPWLLSGDAGGVMSIEPDFLGGTPRVFEGILNESISFRTPGRYQVRAVSRQVGIPLQSNKVEIEIVAAEAGWAEMKLNEAASVLTPTDDCRRTLANGLQGSSSICEESQIQAARTLRFLNTRSAALALVRFFSRWQGMRPDVKDHLRLGLWGSPYRKEVLDALESDLESADVPIDMTWMNTFIELSTVAESGPRPLPPIRIDNPSDDEFKAQIAAQAQYQSEEGRYVANFAPIGKRAFDKLAAAVDRKLGQAQVVSRETLSKRPRQF